ncbi:unnamed protein product [Owenia fusiformis]|uniref:Uncharacterized protein n=1 Tax=Owenia fusiformis TaxID=6347 RepID=A0A8J1TDX2_OWEFU|nr:unnamed protein product [Owenia fusiformis]
MSVSTPEYEPISETEPYPEVESSPEVEPSPEVTNFPEPEPEAEGFSSNGGFNSQALFITLYSLVILLIVLGNLCVVITICSNRKLRQKTTNLLLLSLVISRLMIGIFVVPARIAGQFSEEYLGSPLCKLCHFCAQISSSSSVFSIVAIALVKYREVVLTDLPPLTLKQCRMIIIGLWILGLLYSIRALFVFDLVEEIIEQPNDKSIIFITCNVGHEYKLLSRVFMIADFFTMFLIPFILIIGSYAKVLQKLNAKKNSDNEDKTINNAIHMLIALVILFIACNLPGYVLKLCIHWGSGYFVGSTVVSDVMYIITYSNSWFNIIVYLRYREDIRSAFLQMLKCPSSICCSNGCTCGERVSPVKRNSKSKDDQMVKYSSDFPRKKNSVELKRHDDTIVALEF